MARLAYYRVSTRDQSIEHQRHALGGSFDQEFSDEAVSGAVVARNRPGFAKMLSYMRAGDEVWVTSIDRIGRDSIDVQTTYRDHFKLGGVCLYVQGLGYIEGDAGELILTLLAQLAQMERNRIRERTESGLSTAKEHLALTGKTHRGKTSMGRPRVLDAKEMNQWRKDNQASIATTAAHFSCSTTTVKRLAKVTT